MRDLERELRALAVEWPATPDLAAAVRPRLEASRRAYRLPSRRRLIAVAASLLVVTAGAVEPARSAILELLGFKSVRIERREPRAPAPPKRDALGASLDLGAPVTVAEAARRAGFAPAAPAALPAPDAVYFDRGPPVGGRVSFVYAPRPGLRASQESGVGLLVTEFLADTGQVIAKAAGSATRLERLTIDGSPAFFLTGAHGFAYSDARSTYYEDQRLAGNTLLVERRGLLLRIEGDVSRSRAIAIARSIP